MKRTIPMMRLAPALLAGAMLIAASGCDDGATVAPSDGTLTMQASPGSITIDLDTTLESGSTTVIAQVSDSSGLPVKNVAVLFTSSAGKLASSTNSCGTTSTCSLSLGPCTTNGDCPFVAPKTVLTDSSGFAFDTLTMTLSDPTSATVTGASGTLRGEVVVDKIVDDGNQPPSVTIFAEPNGSAKINELVSFDALDTDDPEGDEITCYQWRVSSSLGTTTELQGPDELFFDDIYTSEQRLEVTLIVSDDPTFVCPRDDSLGALAPDGGADQLSYVICNNPNPPTASITPDPPAPITAGQSVAFTGSASDPEGQPVNLAWNCGNGNTTQTGTNAVCSYPNTGNFTVTLSATDRSIGGLAECALVDLETTVVTVNAAP